MLDALGRNQGVGHLVHHRSLALEHQHFEAMVMVEMNMQRGEHVVITLMLHFREALGKHADVMIVNQRHRADYDAIRPLRRFFDQRVANQIAKRFDRLV